MTQNDRKQWPHSNNVRDAPHLRYDANSGAEDDHEGEAEDAEGECPLYQRYQSAVCQ